MAPLPVEHSPGLQERFETMRRQLGFAAGEI
jgi:hypothetical protein